MLNDERRAVVGASIRAIPDFPKKGILFQDVTTLLLDPKVCVRREERRGKSERDHRRIGRPKEAAARENALSQPALLLHHPIHPFIQAFQYSIDDFVDRYRAMGLDAIAGFEARGFIFGPPIALALGLPFVPLRKPGKLPGNTVSIAYELEYGTDKLEMHADAVQPGARVLLVDDLVATGGTLAAGIALLKQVGAVAVECAAVIELPELNGRAKLSGTPLYVQVEKEDGVPAELAAADSER